MHLAEGTLPLLHALAWSAAAAPLLVWSAQGELRLRRTEDPSNVLMAGATSLIFAVTLLPLPVPVIGATSHICLTPLVALLLGFRRVIWPTCFVLLLQALFFAHGGITTLGVNTLTLGVVGPLSAVAIAGVARRLRFARWLEVGLACGFASLAVYTADAWVLGLALSEVAPFEQTFVSVLLGFAPVQLPLAVLEAACAVAIVRVLALRRPDLLPASMQSPGKPPAPGASRGALTLLLLLALTWGGCSYEGIDATVFGAAAEAAGHPPRESLLDLSQGELGLAMSILVLFALGFVAGRSWERLLGGPRELQR